MPIYESDEEDVVQVHARSARTSLGGSHPGTMRLWRRVCGPGLHAVQMLRIKSMIILIRECDNVEHNHIFGSRLRAALATCVRGTWMTCAAPVSRIEKYSRLRKRRKRRRRSSASLFCFRTRTPNSTPLLELYKDLYY